MSRPSPSSSNDALFTAPGATSRERGVAGVEFLALVKRRERGKLKVYIGSSAGTGSPTTCCKKRLRMAHALVRRFAAAMGFRMTETAGATQPELSTTSA